MAKQLEILVVDDDVDNALSLGELFEIEGHKARVVHSGEDAIAAYAMGHFDIAFMDVMMSGLNGVESFMEIRKFRPNARVFMMTGYSVEELLKQAMEKGAMGVLTKPMDINAIMALVEEVGENGIVVAPRAAADYSAQLHAMMTAAGAQTQLMDPALGTAGLNAGTMPIILDMHEPLIQSVGHYSKLRRLGKVPPTIIVAGSDTIQQNGQDALRDMNVTGVLNKPFDPEELLSKIQKLAS